jgi:allantoate deiminase
MPAAARTVLERCGRLARCSEESGRLTRGFATPALNEARTLIEVWMREAGLETRRDALGNVFGRSVGASGPALMLGSHFDTVRNAGRYDGALGVVAALACAARVRGRELPFAIEVAAFADEEGLRYGTGYLGSSVPAGRFERAWLGLVDDDGVELADAVRAWGGDPAAIAAARRRPDELRAYLEIHIEQGPVLDDRGLPVGVVTGIAGQTRAQVTFTGRAGHAGTTPMEGRRDALAAAAEWIVAVEVAARACEGLVATVGEIAVEPGAGNVIPGRVSASLDLRHRHDVGQKRAVARMRAQAAKSGANRGVQVAFDEIQSTPPVRCSVELTQMLAAAAADAGHDAPQLASGAGHDAAMMAAITPVAVLFVRCAGGVSHNPNESVRAEDVDVALDVATGFIERLAVTDAAQNPSR